MKNSIKIAFVAVIGIAGIAACTSAPEQHNAVSVPTTQTPASAPSSVSSDPLTPPVVTAVVTETVTIPPKPQAVTKVDNRIGYGALKLGMTLDEARATGLTDLTFGRDGDASCVASGNLAISKKYGIERITLPVDAKTSAGIGVGSTIADVKKAYAGATEFRGGYSASVDSTAHYQFVSSSKTGHFADSDKVEVIKIVANQIDCAMAAL